jgi:hypothetical protein
MDNAELHPPDVERSCSLRAGQGTQEPLISTEIGVHSCWFQLAIVESAAGGLAAAGAPKLPNWDRLHAPHRRNDEHGFAGEDTVPLLRIGFSVSTLRAKGKKDSNRDIYEKYGTENFHVSCPPRRADQA